MTLRYVVETVTKEVRSMADSNAYTTGELAEACGTTLRTVQHYDQKGLLATSGYSEGG